jgi:hypothetical protein
MAKSKTPLESFFYVVRKDMKTRDRLAGRTFDDNVTVDYLIGLYYGQKGLDYHTGLSMCMVKGLVDGAVKPDLCTPDRIDNTLGYTVGNILLARWDINKLRGNMTLSEFYNVCKLIGLNAK